VQIAKSLVLRAELWVFSFSFLFLTFQLFVLVPSSKALARTHFGERGAFAKRATQRHDLGVGRAKDYRTLVLPSPCLSQSRLVRSDTELSA
jgi:hypothetical protein